MNASSESRHRYAALCLLVLLVAGSCATASRASLRIVVLEPGRGAVGTAEVLIDGETAGLTDDAGRLVIEAPLLRGVVVSVTKPGHESARTTVRATGEDQLLLVELYSAGGLIRAGTVALDAGAYTTALALGRRAFSTAPEDPRACALAAVAALRADDLALAREAAAALYRCAPGETSALLMRRVQEAAQ